MKVGERVRVPFAGRMYIALVSRVECALPEGIKPSSVREIYGTEGLDVIMPTEIDFFRRIADYYMCTVGEVYKAAYPSVRNEKVNSRIKESAYIPPSPAPALSDSGRIACGKVRECLGRHKPILLRNLDSENILLNLCMERRPESNVLWLVPEIDEGHALGKRLSDILGSQLIVWDSNLTPARRREAVRKIRDGRGYIVLGTRSALFLPHHDLSMVIVSDEHDPSYKQSSPAPRYNGRDAAIILAGIFSADVILTSLTPSLDSLFNNITGKYLMVDTQKRADIDFDIVDTLAELKKNGMCGDLSRRLINAAASAPLGGFAIYKPRQAAFPKTEELEQQISALLPRDTFYTDNLALKPIPSSCTTLAIMGIDALLGKLDFKADEKVVQLISGAIQKCPGTLRNVIIQTKESSHPVFRSLSSSDINGLLTERKNFSYPPFTRIVDILIADNIDERRARMTRALFETLSQGGFVKVTPSASGLRVVLKKDSRLLENKKKLLNIVEEFEKANKWLGHVAFDADPR